MHFQYFRPRSDIRKLVSSYYHLTIPEPLSDVMRAEIANVRFVLKGEIFSDIGGVEKRYAQGCAVLCGPTHKWSHIRFSEGAEILGAAITPFGWHRMVKIPADRLADQTTPLEHLVPSAAARQISDLFSTQNHTGQIDTANDLFATLDDDRQPLHGSFLDQATRWLIDPNPNELSDLLASIDLSHRQVERLCKVYFGCSPKRLHRKFRALHSANRLTWQELTDWRDIATTAYFDQSHFIREFKHFNGRTPLEFIKGAHILVRQTLKERLQIDHDSPFSLVG